VFFNKDANPSSFNNLVFPALRALNSVGPENLLVLDLMQFLPPSSSFPSRALGSQLLINIGSQSLCQGIDERYAAEYFDIISRNFATRYLELPEELRQRSLERWMEELGASVDHWMVYSVWFITPLIRSEGIHTKPSHILRQKSCA
jgi:hypothetical protein